MTAVKIPITEQQERPAPKWCGTVLSCICGNKLTPARTAQLVDVKAIRCANCKTLIDGKAMEGAA